MDAKDLRTEAALGDRSNDGNSKYTQASVLQANRNKTYHDVGSNTLAKVEGQGARPCAVIGPDRVVPPPAPADAYLKKASVEPWPTHETTYRKPPEYPHKLPDYNHPSRNISPRQTFQENMQRFMLPPSYNSTKLKEDHNFPIDANGAPLRNKQSGSAEGKYCEVPYVVSPLASEQKNVRSADVSVSNNNQTLPKSAPHGWPPSSANIRPAKPYGAPEVYQYPEYQNCSAPRPVLVPRPHRTVHEDPGHMYPESYYHDANLRYKPYPTIKDRNPQARYDYVGNYSNPFHPPPPPFPSHKYEIQKQLPPHPYAGYPQVPLKYMDTRMADPAINGFQRPINPHTNFNSVAYRNQMIHPQYGPVPGNCLQPNKFYPYPPDKNISANKPPYDATTHKAFGDYENMRGKPYHMSETYYVNEMMRGHPIKASQVMPPSYPTVGMPGMPPHPYYYRKDNNPTMINYENNPHYRNIDPSINLNAAMLSRLPTQFSPNAIAISPSESNTSNDNTNSLGTSQEDCGYVSQSSSASIRSVDSGLNRMQGDFYRRYDYRYGPMVKFPPPSKLNISSNTNLESKNKKNIDLRQYLQMWNEGEDENGESTNKEMIGSSSSNKHEIINHNGNPSHEQLYVLGLVNVPSEELSKYEHIQKVSKLPENIKGYNSIELLNQFEEVIESSNLNNYSGKPPTPRSFQMSSLQGSTMQSIGIPSRPLSPLDVEAKISQSVIHKEVGCNFEIKPCSPKMLNVEVATPIKNVLSERVIEKVNNPVSSPTTGLTKIDNNVRDCEIITHHDHRISLNDNKSSSCKMISSQYTSSEHSNSAKSNYSLQDLESNSGVCLASLPRLDNDIELTFPEVNQQFINANKVESVITTTQKDLPSLDIDQSEVMQEIVIKKSLLEAEPEKEFSKLSKYRKRRRNSDVKEDLETSVQSIRTNSVIMKNPENTKFLEKCANNFTTIDMQDAQRDPINLSVYSEVRENVQKSDYIENSRNISQNLKQIGFSENSNIDVDIDNKGSFIDKNQDLRRDERCDQEIISTNSVVVPNNAKSKNDINCVLETSDIKENKLECNVETSEDIAPVAKIKKIDHMYSEGNMLKVDQITLKDASEHEKSILTDDIKQVEETNSFQLSECRININDDKISLEPSTVTTKHKTSTEEKTAEKVLSVNNTSLLDDKTFKGIQEGSGLLEDDNLNLSDKLSQEYENLSKPDVTSNVLRSEIQPVTEELCDTVPQKNESNLGMQENENTTTKLHKELYSPRIQNLILFTEGNPNKPPHEADSDIKQESAKIDVRMQTTLEDCDVGDLKKQRIFDSEMAAENSEECLDEKSRIKQNTVSCDVMVNIQQDISAQTADDDLQHVSDDLRDTLKNNNCSDTNEHTEEVQQVCTDLVDSKNSVSFFNDDSSESDSSTSSTTDSDSSDDLSDVTSSFEGERDLLSPSTSKDLFADVNATELQSTESENLKKNIKAALETANTFSGTLDPSNGKHVILDEGLFKKTTCNTSVDRNLDFKISFGTDIETKDKPKINCSDEDKLNENDSTFIEADGGGSLDNSGNKDTQECNNDILSDKDSTLIKTDECDSMDHSESKDSQECKEKILGDNKDIPCEYSINLDMVDDTKLCTHFSENSDFLVDCTNEEKVIIVGSTILKEKESHDFTQQKIVTEDCQKLIKEIKNKDLIDLQHNDDAQIDNVHYSGNKLPKPSLPLEDICNDSEHLVEPEVEENSNKSFQKNNTSVLYKDLNQRTKSFEETIEMIRNFNDLAEFFNTNYSHNSTKPLKRSLSDSAIHACNISQGDNKDNGMLLNKRMKTAEPVTLQSQYITENYCNIIQNNRRNSISSVYNEENVSFCILIENNCILTEECEESDKFCYTEIPEHCLSCIESDGDNEIIEESTELISVQDEINYDHCENISCDKDSSVVEEKELQEPWVDDIACVETVVSEEVAEDVVVSDSTSPRDKDMSDDDNDIFNMNEHTDKVKYIYGEGMCTDDAYIVETLYRTPQMDVNKTLVCRESQDIDDCHRYYDNESLEKLLSESPTSQNEKDRPLSAKSPSPNTDTGSIDKPDLNKDLSLAVLQTNSRLNEVECTAHDSSKTQDDTVHSCETSVDDVFSYDHVKENAKRTSSSPEVSSTTSEERNSSIRLKITTFGGSRVAQVNNVDGNKSITSVSCKYTEKKVYAESHNNLLPNRPLITKAAQKYIPPLKETIRDLKVKLPLPQHSLLKLKELKLSKEEPKVTNNKVNKHNTSNCIRKEIPKKTKPKFEDVLKSIDDLQFKMHKEKSKKNNKKLIPKVVIKKNENGSHYTSTSNKERYNPDLTGRKWQPWVFIEKNLFIDKMALKKKTKAVFSHRKNTFILAETFKKYKSCNAKFVISQPVFSESSTGHLKYTIRLKHSY